MLKQRMMGEVALEVNSDKPSIERLEEKITLVLEMLREFDLRISIIEDSVKPEEKTKNVRLRPRRGQPIVPNLYRDIYMDTGDDPLFPLPGARVNIKDILTESLENVLEVVNENTHDGTYLTTNQVAEKLKLNRTTISSRLNLLNSIGLISKKKGRYTKYQITESGSQVLVKH